MTRYYKKFIEILSFALCVFPLASFTASDAAEVKLGGRMHIVASTSHAMTTDAYYGRTPGQYVPLDIQQKVQMDFSYIANENLSGFIQLEAGHLYDYDTPTKWGMGPKFLSNDGFKVSQAYLDWNVPGTKAKVRMGLQPFWLPFYSEPYKSPMYNNLLPGVILNVPAGDAVSVSAMYFRTGTASHDETSGGNWVVLSGDLKLGGLKFTPWFTWLNRTFAGLVYKVDRHVSAGAGFEFVPENTSWKFTGDFIWAISKNMVDPNPYAYRVFDTKGWLAIATASYRTKYGTPAVKAWYASGDAKGKGSMSGQMYGLSGALALTNVYFGNAYNPAMIGYNGTRYTHSKVWGTSGIMLEWGGLSFMPGLIHTGRLAYVRGTNSPRSQEAAMYGGHCGYMTCDDHFVEADLDTMLFLDPKLMVTLQLGYLWEGFKNPMVKNGWRTTLSVTYTF